MKIYWFNQSTATTAEIDAGEVTRVIVDEQGKVLLNTETMQEHGWYVVLTLEERDTIQQKIEYDGESIPVILYDRHTREIEAYDEMYKYQIEKENAELEKTNDPKVWIAYSRYPK